MPRIKTTSGLAATGFLLALLGATSPTQALPAEGSAPSVTNGGFELCTQEGGVTPCTSGTGALPDFWDSISVLGSGSASWTTGASHTGDASARLDDPDDSSTAGLTSHEIPVVPGQTMVASAWFQKVSGSGGEPVPAVLLRFFDSTGANVGQASSSAGSMSATQWHLVATSATAPSSAATAILMVYSCANGCSGEFYVDDAVLAPFA